MKGGGEVARGATTAAHHSHPSLSMLLRGHTPHPVTAAEIVQVGGGSKDYNINANNTEANNLPPPRHQILLTWRSNVTNSEFLAEVDMLPLSKNGSRCK